MKRSLVALFTGALFAVGLAVGGMTQPAKVVGFLDFFGAWDASLAFVMGGAIAVYLPLYRLITRRRAPVLSVEFLIPTRRDLDKRLIAGSALFGVGWGLAGFCPGPALTSAGALAPAALLFAGSMVAGFSMHRLWEQWAAKRAEARQRSTQVA